MVGTLGLRPQDRQERIALDKRSRRQRQRRDQRRGHRAGAPAHRRTGAPASIAMLLTIAAAIVVFRRARSTAPAQATG